MGAGRREGFTRLPSSRLLEDDPRSFDDGEDDDDDASSPDAHIIQDPAVEADFCLALEMVRHRPLRLLSVEQDRGPKSDSEQATSVHWQHSRSMRMYIDPTASRTIDFFQRKFCLDPSVSQSLFLFVLFSRSILFPRRGNQRNPANIVQFVASTWW